MIKVSVNKKTRCGVSAPVIKRALKKFLKMNGVEFNTSVVVNIVGKNEMLALARKYLNEKYTVHNVLSFPEDETRKDFVYPPGTEVSLGEIYVCYPKVLEEIEREKKLIDEKVVELVEHSALHLLGVHHE